MPTENVIILTDRLSLAPVDKSDLDHVWTATRHPGFNDGMLWDAPDTRAEMVGWTERTLQLAADGKQYTFTARSRNSDAFIGRVGIRPVEGERTYRIGFWVHPSEWHKGYATEMAMGGLAFAFDVLQAATVTVAHAVWNKASARVIEKAGFQFSQYVAEGFKKRDQWVAEREYTLDAERWRAMRPNLSIRSGRS